MLPHPLAVHTSYSGYRHQLQALKWCDMRGDIRFRQFARPEDREYEELACFYSLNGQVRGFARSPQQIRRLPKAPYLRLLSGQRLVIRGQR